MARSDRVHRGAGRAAGGGRARNRRQDRQPDHRPDRRALAVLRARVAACGREEDGQYLPIFAALLFALLIVAFTFFQVGAAATLKSRVQTAADAAALAGEVEIKRQLEAVGAEGLAIAQINPVPVCAAAAAYAAQNEATLESCQVVLYDVKVVVRGSGEIKGELSGRDGAKANARARASLGVRYANGLGVLGGGGGPLTSGGDDNCMTDREIDEVSKDAGIDVRGDSALRRYCGTGQESGVDVRDLKPEMKVAIAKAEKELGHGLNLNSAFRTVAYQRELCARVSGPCAPPGQSMHNFGMAVDVADYGQLAPIAGKVGLCQPLPSDDAVHFSLASGPECGGRGGVGPGGGGAGGFGGFAVYMPKLVPWEGGDFSIPDLAFGAPPGDVRAALARIAQCESGGDPTIEGKGKAAGHYGKYQFDIPTWQSVGGTGNPAAAPEAEQDARAYALWRMRGFQPWECAFILGII
jgi:transglycosylase-like protein/putative Flp pilus-assembly TadE/G-like protein